MNDRFTERVKKVLFLARDEAGRLQRDYIGTEHILMGIVREGEGIAAKSLQNLGLSFQQIQRTIERMVARSGGTLKVGEIPFTPRAKRVLELSVEEARLLRHDHIGTEHLLLGLLREGEGVAARVLMELGANRERIREEILELLGSGPIPREDAKPTSGTAETFFSDRRVTALIRILIRKGVITQEEMDQELHGG